MIQNENEIKEQIEIFGKKINILKDNIKEIINLLNKVTENLEIYYSLNYDILYNNEYLNNNKNYCMLQNIMNIKSNIDLADIDEII